LGVDPAGSETWRLVRLQKPFGINLFYCFDLWKAALSEYVGRDEKPQNQ
jgi:hypothetical protein